MSTNVWILNHYASPPSLTTGLRHYNFGKYLIRDGYNVTVFAANQIHNSSRSVDTAGNLYCEDADEGVPFVFVKTTPYTGNGFSRVKNMLSFYVNVQRAAKIYAQKHGKPDVILASSVHPLTIVAGIQLAKHFGVKCIAEVRDLWLESIVCYKGMSRKNPIIIALYLLEKWMYKHADRLIFTMEGGKDYIIERGWDKEHGGPVDLNKVHHVNNGVDLEEFDYNKEHFTTDDEDLNDPDTFKVVYTGSIRAVNSVGILVDAAQLLQHKAPHIKLLLWGTGNELEQLKQRVSDEHLCNIVFKGRAEKRYICYIVSKADVNILHARETDIMRFGMSPNKLFDYLAAQKPVILTFLAKDDLLNSKAIIQTNGNSGKEICETIIKLSKMSVEEYLSRCDSARIQSQAYDYKVLARHLADILKNEDVVK